MWQTAAAGSFCCLGWRCTKKLPASLSSDTDRFVPCRVRLMCFQRLGVADTPMPGCCLSSAICSAYHFQRWPFCTRSEFQQHVQCGRNHFSTVRHHTAREDWSCSAQQACSRCSFQTGSSSASATTCSHNSGIRERFESSPCWACIGDSVVRAAIIKIC